MTTKTKRVKRLWVSVSEGCGEPGNCCVVISIYRFRKYAQARDYTDLLVSNLCVEGFEKATGIKATSGEVFPITVRRVK